VPPGRQGDSFRSACRVCLMCNTLCLVRPRTLGLRAARPGVSEDRAPGQLCAVARASERARGVRAQVCDGERSARGACRVVGGAAPAAPASAASLAAMAGLAPPGAHAGALPAPPDAGAPPPDPALALVVLDAAAAPTPRRTVPLAQLVGCAPCAPARPRCASALPLHSTAQRR